MKKNIVLLALLTLQMELINTQKYLISGSFLNTKNLKRFLIAAGTVATGYGAKKLLKKIRAANLRKQKEASVKPIKFDTKLTTRITNTQLEKLPGDSGNNDLLYIPKAPPLIAPPGAINTQQTSINTQDVKTNKVQKENIALQKTKNNNWLKTIIAGAVLTVAATAILLGISKYFGNSDQSTAQFNLAAKLAATNDTSLTNNQSNFTNPFNALATNTTLYQNQTDNNYNDNNYQIDLKNNFTAENNPFMSNKSFDQKPSTKIKKNA